MYVTLLEDMLPFVSPGDWMVWSDAAADNATRRCKLEGRNAGAAARVAVARTDESASINHDQARLLFKPTKLKADRVQYWCKNTAATPWRCLPRDGTSAESKPSYTGRDSLGGNQVRPSMA
mmetsp:Transcript_4613/g.7266  ORF Transcript_4613/g.7266 Transcript_4613/m.7266 type:complete len:121 (-) Transcript_4613:3-365(-)